MNQIKCKRLFEDAKLPTRAYPSDAGIDLYVHSAFHHDEQWRIGTGVAVQIPPGFVGLVCPLSCMNRCGYTTRVEVIDSGYDGEIELTIGTNERNRRNRNTMVLDAKIAQLVIVPCLIGDVVEEHFEGGKRGRNGFGSSGQ